MITLSYFTLAQDLEEKKAEPATPHFLSLNQDIVARSQEVKCGLKYVIHISECSCGFWIIKLKLKLSL
jgi:hypothetical protein